jgi:signal transduction histidine kinase
VANIFDPLVRVSSPETQKQRRRGSIGLGLYIAREVAVAHGGDIEVTSSEAAGTVFTVRLPRLRVSR